VNVVFMTVVVSYKLVAGHRLFQRTLLGYV